MALPSQSFRLPPRILAAYVAVLIVLWLFFALIARLAQVNQPLTGFKAPDDIQIARELLAQKLTGPQYFQTGGDTAQTPFPYISVVAAKTQIERIVKARQLPPDALEQVENLIIKLTRPASSQMVGIDHVNVLQLNLALDKLRRA